MATLGVAQAAAVWSTPTQSRERVYWCTDRPTQAEESPVEVEGGEAIINKKSHDDVQAAPVGDKRRQAAA